MKADCSLSINYDVLLAAGLAMLAFLSVFVSWSVIDKNPAYARQGYILVYSTIIYTWAMFWILALLFKKK